MGTLFILTLFALFCIIESSYSENNFITGLTKGKKAKAKSKSKKGKSKKGIKGKKAKKPKIPKPLKALKLTALDMSVCGHGKNLGTLDIGYNCQSQFNPTCKRIVHRQNIPNKSKIAKMKKAA